MTRHNSTKRVVQFNPPRPRRPLVPWLHWRGLPFAIFIGIFMLVCFALGAYLALNELLPVDETKKTGLFDVTRLALTVAAGLGGLVALVVAYRKQKDLEEGRFIERFGAAAAQLGHTDVAVRMAGVYAMAGAADRTHDSEQRQQCIDVLCGYLRLPYSAEAGDNHQTRVVQRRLARSPGEEDEIHYQYRQNDREVRQTIVRVIATHLQPTARSSWSSYDFDFAGALLEAADFTDAVFNGESVSFYRAMFNGRATSFNNAIFSGTETLFHGATFGGEVTDFARALFSGKHASFSRAVFGAETTSLAGAVFDAERNWFVDAAFLGAKTSFASAVFSGQDASFLNVVFSSNDTFFVDVTFSGERISFRRATFSGERTSFARADFGKGSVSFGDPKKWDPPPQFDWDPGRKRMAKPANVAPDEWPPLPSMENDL